MAMSIPRVSFMSVLLHESSSKLSSRRQGLDLLWYSQIHLKELGIGDSIKFALFGTKPVEADIGTPGLSTGELGCVQLAKQTELERHMPDHLQVIWEDMLNWQGDYVILGGLDLGKLPVPSQHHEQEGGEFRKPAKVQKCRHLRKCKHQ